ncbi:MAG TPA: M36 family metallopeptidase [Marmoricola sp.]
MNRHSFRASTTLFAVGALALTAAPATAGLAQTGSSLPAAAGAVSRDAAAARPTQAERKGWYDARTTGPAAARQRPNYLSSRQRLAATRLRHSLGSEGVVSLDPFTRTPRNVANLDGYLTGPSRRPAAAVGLDYVRAHRAVFGLSRAAIASLRLRKDYVDVLGTHHLSWQMMVDGVPVFDNGLRAHVTRDGRLIAVQGSPLATVPKVSVSPRLSASAARAVAARDVGGRVEAAVPVRSAGARRATVWSNRDAASLVVSMTPSGPRLGWMTYVQAGDALSYLHVIDADNGQVLYRADLSRQDNAPVAPRTQHNALVYRYYPGAPRGGRQVRVNMVRRHWLPGRATGLSGPFAFAYSDVNDDNTAEPTEKLPAPRGRTARFRLQRFHSSRLCDPRHLCTWNPGVARSWAVDRRQDGVQAFYFVNNWHDHLLARPIGFTRAAGNFERSGHDPVVVNTLDGAATAQGLPDANHIDNANFSTPPDGTPPLMQMYLFHAPGLSDANEPFVPTSGAQEADIVYHEYTHGLSSRLVVDSSGVEALDALQSGAMGEAWSDWYAFDYLVAHKLQPDTSKAGDVLVGKYVAHNAPLIRYQGLDCPVGSTSPRCPGTPGAGRGGFTYGDFGKIAGAPEVHADGEIWGETLWDLRRAIGSHDAELLVTRGMELSVPQPSYLDMRNAILQADVVAKTHHHMAIWRVFAHRGMGWFAGSLGANDPAPTEDFHLPPPPAAPHGRVTGTVTDRFTRKPIAGAVVAIAGHRAGVVGRYKAVTDTAGHYRIKGVVAGAYPKLTLVAPGYERLIAPVRVKRGRTVHNFRARRDWSARKKGARVTNFNGPDYRQFGCGPGAALDQSQGRGWSTTTGADTNPTGTIVPKFMVVRLPRAVNVTSFAVNPSNTCGDPGSSSTGDFRIETSTDGSSYSTAAKGTFTAADRAKLVSVRPTGATSGVRYVKFWILGPQVPNFPANCPNGPYGGCQFTDLTELEVFGRATA